MYTHVCLYCVSAALGILLVPLTVAQPPTAKPAPPAMMKEPISAERLQALQRPKFNVQSPVPAADPKPPPIAAPRMMLDRVLFDEPGDGSLWALGNTYKASFTSEEFTYIPRFGPDAPQNFPIAFSIAEVGVGGNALSISDGVPVQENNRVSINRGALRESYDLLLNSVEQTFALDAPPGRGSMIIRLNVRTELAATSNDHGLVFTHELGTVTYSRAIVVDAASNRTEVPTRLAPTPPEGFSIEESTGEMKDILATGTPETMTIEIELPASLLATAAYPIVIDPVLQTNSVQTGLADRYPDAAYDNFTQVFRVVFEEQYSATDGDVYSYRIDQITGAVIAGSLTTIDFTGDNWRQPKISHTPSSFMVVAPVGHAPNRVIRGRTCSASTTATGSQFTIGDPVNYPGDETHVDIGGLPYGPLGDGMQFVVWQNEYSATDHDILGRALRSAGNFFTGILEIDYSTADDINPSISATGFGVHAVAFERIYSPTDHDIYGAGIEYEGPIVVHPAFPVDTTGVDNRHPRVSHNMGTLATGYMYAYVYEEGPATAADIYTRVMQLNPDTSATAIYAQANITAMDGVNFETRAPVVEGQSSHPNRFVVAYEELYHGSVNDWDAYASSFCFDFASIRHAERHRRLAYTSSDDSHLMGASRSGSVDFPEMLFVWGELSGGFGGIQNARYDIPATCCAWDVNHDGVTNIDDLVSVITTWGPCVNCNSDVNGDTFVNIDDLVLVITGWGPCG